MMTKKNRLHNCLWGVGLLSLFHQHVAADVTHGVNTDSSIAISMGKAAHHFCFGPSASLAGRYHCPLDLPNGQAHTASA